MKTKTVKRISLLLLCIFLLSSSAFAASPAEVIGSYNGEDLALKEKAVDYLNDLLETLAEDGLSSDEPVSFDEDSGYLSLSFTSMDGIKPEMILSGDAQPHHREWKFVCHNESGEQGLLSYIVYDSGETAYSCIMNLPDEEMLPSKEDLAADITELVGSNVDQVLLVSTFDYGVTTFFLISADGEFYIMPHQLGWDTPDVQTMSYFTAESSVGSCGHSLADTDKLMGFLAEVRESQTGMNEDGEFVFGGGLQIEMKDGKPFIVTETDVQTIPGGTTAESMLFVGGLLVIFAVLAYGDRLFRKN